MVKGKKALNLDRMKLLYVVFFVVFFVIIAKLFYIQIIQSEYYAKKARSQHLIEQKILQKRGEVYMYNSKNNNKTPLIINQNLNLLVADPNQVKLPRQAASQLAGYLYDKDGECQELIDKDSPDELIEKCEKSKQKRELFYAKLSKQNDPYEILAHYLTKQERQDIEQMELDGIYFEPEWVRHYPEREVAGVITGFLGYQQYRRVGQYGVEGYWEKELAGEAGRIFGAKDNQGKFIADALQEIKETQNGFDIVLTLDKIVQNKVYEILSQAVKDYQAEKGSILVMEPDTGRIQAMVDYPSFDPNNYSQVEDVGLYANSLINSSYEPGSIFKMITMAAGIDSQAIKPTDVFEDKGFVEIGEHKIKNADEEKFGKITMTEILEKSVNTGSVFIVLETGLDRFRDYVYKFGFGKKLGIGLNTEMAGDISSLNKAGDIYLATASYGQGILVSPLQMATAMSTIVNNGVKVSPQIVDYLAKDGEKVEIKKNIPKDKVISQRSAQTLKAILVSVVKNGHAKGAGVDGYFVGGKTGTAEIAAKGGYSEHETIHSFVGFGPFEDPKFVILVRLDKPKVGKYSAMTAAPTFAKVAKFLFQYYSIAPSE